MEPFINFIYLLSEGGIGVFSFSNLGVAHGVNVFIKSHKGGCDLLLCQFSDVNILWIYWYVKLIALGFISEECKRVWEA